nr:MAG TPA: hypothetical protein [Caudoviricetes sp.]
MKFEDLNDVDIGDVLKCKDLDVTFEVVEIDMATKLTPIRVKMLSGYSSTELVSGVSTSDRFDESYKQWLYANPENLRAYVPCLEDSVDVSKLITLDRLEPLVDVTEPEYENLKELTESEEFEAITASQAAELSKRKILRELMDRIREAISSDLGVFELKVPDLDLDPVTSDLEWLGYMVRFSMQDDEFTISWEP